MTTDDHPNTAAATVSKYEVDIHSAKHSLANRIQGTEVTVVLNTV